MSHNLVALHEDLNMLGRLPGQATAGKAARHRSQEAAIARTGQPERARSHLRAGPAWAPVPGPDGR
jgi:hypothetical protein